MTWAKGEGSPGLGYIIFNNGGVRPIANARKDESVRIDETFKLSDGDALFFTCDKLKAAKFSKARLKIARIKI